MQKYDLKPCPFCGNRAEFESYYPGKNQFYVCCQTCESMGFTGTKELAAERWNNRTQTLEDVQKLNNEQNNSSSVQKLKNERGAGRKRFIHVETDDVIHFYSLGWSYRKIADMCNISLGSVHKLITEQKRDEVEREKNKKPA